ncbi:MAG TPA: hypothetical protein VMM17_08950, partial [Gemmatimonadaceae bacterium]|nr:hypothetical protein [Gemmatimonadaceae bacterium]
MKSPFARAWMLTAAVLATVGCAPAGTGTTAAPAPSTEDQTISADQPWPVHTREHVDLWLHGFALLQDDTSRVPLFRRGYRDDLIVARNALGVTTLLDVNRGDLRERFAQNRLLFNAQFVALYFRSAADLRQAIDYFLRAEGNPQAAPSREVAAIISVLAGYFPAQGDRNWLRVFWESLSDESAKFYHDYWVREQRTRATVLTAVDSLWQRVYRPRLQTYLANTQQARGALLLSLPINGEGRTLNLGPSGALVVVTFPDQPASAVEAIYVAVHELAISVTQTAVNDNLTPAEQRAGLGDRYASAAAVRGGAMLLQRLAPELADGYARYYLRAANQPAGSNVQTSLAN